MKLYRKPLLLFSLLTIGLCLQAAQTTASSEPFPPRGPEARLQRQAERLKHDLQLTDQQYADLLALNEAQLAKLQTLRQQARSQRTTPEALRQQGEALRAAHQAAIDALLTPAQRTRKAELETADFRAHLTLRQARLQHDDLIVARELERLTYTLLLSTDQQAQVEGFIRQRNAAAQQLVAQALAAENPDRQAFRAGQQTLNHQFRDQLKGVLNPAQMEKAQQMARHRMGMHTDGPHPPRGMHRSKGSQHDDN